MTFRAGLVDVILMRFRFTLQSPRSIDQVVSLLNERIPEPGSYPGTASPAPSICIRKHVTADGVTVEWITPYWGHYARVVAHLHARPDGTSIEGSLVPRCWLRWAFWLFGFVTLVVGTTLMASTPTVPVSGGAASAVAGLLVITLFPWLIGMRDVTRQRRWVAESFSGLT